MLLTKDKSLSLSISCTTRPRRKGEINKKDYIFLSEDQFNLSVRKSKFLEFASVFGYKYGTLKNSVNRNKYIIQIHRIFTNLFDP